MQSFFFRNFVHFLSKKKSCFKNNAIFAEKFSKYEEVCIFLDQNTY